MFHVSEGSRAESLLALCVALFIVMSAILAGCLIGGAPARADYICIGAIVVDVLVLFAVVPRIERADRE